MPSCAQRWCIPAAAWLLIALATSEARAAVGCDRLLAWTLQVQQEHPGQNLTEIPIEKVTAFAMPLFNDQSFATVFGRTYDRLTDDERASIWSDFTKCQQTRGMGTQLLWQGIVLQKPFATGHGLNPMVTQVRAHVVQARAASIQVKQLERELDALPPTAAGAQRLSAIERISASPLAFLWPSEGKAFAARVAAARTRMTGPTVAARIDSLIAASNSYASLAELTPETSPVRTQLASLSAEQRASYTKKMLARRSVLLTSMLHEERLRINAIPAGVPGLQAAMMWDRQFESRYGAFGSDPLVKALRKDFVTYRTQQLDRYTPLLEDSVKVARSSAEMQALFARTLGLPGDNAHPAVMHLMQSASQRVAAIGQEQQSVQLATRKQLAAQQQAAASKQAAAQKAAAESRASTAVAATHGASSTAHVKSKGVKLDAATDALADSVAADMDEYDHDEPTAKEMYYAVERQMKIQEANTEAVLKRCDTGGATSAMQMACSLMKAARGSGAGASVTLVSLEKVSCENDEGYPSTFDCDYNAEYKSTNPSLQKMLELGGAQLEHGTFAWSKGKWTKLADDQ